MNRALPLIREGIVPHRCRHGMVIALVAGMLAGPAYVCAETVYVQTKTAQLRSGKTSLDSVVANVKYGEALDVVRRDGNWIEVKTSGGANGWIFSNKTSSSKPSRGSSLVSTMALSPKTGYLLLSSADCTSSQYAHPGRRPDNPPVFHWYRNFILRT